MEFILILGVIAIVAIPGLAMVAIGLSLISNAFQKITKQ